MLTTPSDSWWIKHREFRQILMKLTWGFWDLLKLDCKGGFW